MMLFANYMVLRISIDIFILKFRTTLTTCQNMLATGYWKARPWYFFPIFFDFLTNGICIMQDKFISTNNRKSHRLTRCVDDMLTFVVNPVTHSHGHESSTPAPYRRIPFVLHYPDHPFKTTAFSKVDLENTMALSWEKVKGRGRSHSRTSNWRNFSFHIRPIIPKTWQTMIYHEKTHLGLWRKGYHKHCLY